MTSAWLLYVLQVQDFLLRTRSQRFSSIEKDMQMLVAHCGSLFLDPATLAQVGSLAEHTVMEPVANILERHAICLAAALVAA